MKVACTAAGPTLDSAFDNRFGRAKNFIIYDTESDTFTVIDNTQNLNSAQGAGVQAAQFVINSGAQALITGHLGPKAAKVIYGAGLEVYSADVESVKEALAMYKSKALKPLKDSDVEGHWE